MKSEEKYKPVAVAFGQSCINFNTDFVCRNNCLYCFGKNWSNRHLQFNPSDMISELPHSSYIGNLPVCINNSAADPFQPGTAERTMQSFDLLVNHGVKNIMIITKEWINDEYIRHFQDIIAKTNVNLFIFVSYGALPKEYEVLVSDRREEMIKRLSESGIPTILYARPIIVKNGKIVNDLNKIVELSKYANYVVWSSVRVDDNIKQNDAKNLLPDSTGSSLHKSHKRIDDASFHIIEDTLAKCYCEVFRKTSCSISAYLKIPDYNCHWSDPHLYGCNSCNSQQQSICNKQAEKIPCFSEDVQKILDKYKLPKYKESLPGAWVLEANMKTFSCLRAGILRKITGFQVKFPFDNEIITAENLAYKHYELRGEPEGNVPVKGFIEAY